MIDSILWHTAGADADAPLRIIEIAGVDSCTCCGTHVRGSSELQVVKLLGTSSVRGHARLHFVFGNRLTRLLGVLLANEAKLTELLSCGRDDHAEACPHLHAC